MSFDIVSILYGDHDHDMVDQDKDSGKLLNSTNHMLATILGIVHINSSVAITGNNRRTTHTATAYLICGH